MTQPNLLIIGATGTNGRALIDALDGKGESVRALVRNTASAKTTLPDWVDLIEGDLADPASLDHAFDGVDKVFMVTSVQPNTIALFTNAYAAASKANVAQFVKFSGLGASTDSPSEVIRQHGETDEVLRDSGLPFTILRPNSFHQNMLWQADGISKTGQFFLPLGDAAQSTIDVRDIADVAAEVLLTEGHIGKTYDLTGPESLTFEDVARILGNVRGSPVSYTAISREAAEAAMKDAGMPEWSAHALAEIQALFATGAYADVHPDAATLLNRPLRRFIDFARDHESAFSPTQNVNS